MPRVRKTTPRTKKRSWDPAAAEQIAEPLPPRTEPCGCGCAIFWGRQQLCQICHPDPAADFQKLPRTIKLIPVDTQKRPASQIEKMMFDLWRNGAVRCWQKIKDQAVREKDQKREDYAVWMLETVLAPCE